MTTPSKPLPFEKAQTEAMFSLQKDLVELYELSGRAWLDRTKSEMELWSRLATKLTGDPFRPRSHGSLPELHHRADAHERGRRKTTVRRLSEDHAKDRWSVRRQVERPTASRGGY